MRISIGVPTAEEGVYSPMNFGGPSDIVRIARVAEAHGFYAVWGLDFITPSSSMGIRNGEVPNWYEVLMSLAALASVTNTIRLASGVIVLPQREPILLAKQITTLDVWSGGRAILGVGVGGHRDAFRAMFPRLANVNRSELLEEQLESLRLLLTRAEATFEGQHIAFSSVSLNPKPLQDPLPVYLAGNHPQTPMRVARWCDGWLMSVSTSVEPFANRVAQLHECLEERGRPIDAVDVTAVGVLSVARTHEAAVKRVRNSRVMKRAQGQDFDDFVRRNPIGTPEEITEKMLKTAAEGATHYLLANRANQDAAEMEQQTRMVGEEVLPALAKG